MRVSPAARPMKYRSMMAAPAKEGTDLNHFHSRATAFINEVIIAPSYRTLRLAHKKKPD
jgi:hypothetical protein